MTTKRLNPMLVDLIEKILVKESERISIAGIMKHPWVTATIPNRQLNINF